MNYRWQFLELEITLMDPEIYFCNQLSDNYVDSSVLYVDFYNCCIVSLTPMSEGRTTCVTYAKCLGLLFVWKLNTPNFSNFFSVFKVIRRMVWMLKNLMLDYRFKNNYWKKCAENRKSIYTLFLFVFHRFNRL